MPRAPRLTVENIVPDLRPLACPIEWVSLLPGNPRKGRIDQIAKSYSRFGQRKPIVVNKTGEVDGHPVGYSEAGNHQLQACRDKLGWTYMAMVWVEDDEATAKAFSLADNRLHDLGEYDTPLLADFVADLANQAAGVEMLVDAGFGEADLRRLLESQLPAPDVEGGVAPGMGGGSVGLGTPVISTSIVFDDNDQQDLWYKFIRFLRGEYPDAETTGERLAEYIANHVPLDD